MFWGLLSIGTGAVIGGLGIAATTTTGTWCVVGWTLVVVGLGLMVAAFVFGGRKRLDSGLVKRLEAELVAIIDEGEALGPDAFTPPDYGPYVLWRDQTADFLRTVFGETERQRFLEACDPPPASLSRNLEDHLKRLRDLRDNRQRWDPQVNAEGLRKAGNFRRRRSEAEQIVEARPPIPRGGELADLYREGEAAWRESSSPPSDLPLDKKAMWILVGGSAQEQLEREAKARDWDKRVSDELWGRPETKPFAPAWAQAGEPPAPSGRADQSRTNPHGVAVFYEGKLGELATILKRLNP